MICMKRVPCFFFFLLTYFYQVGAHGGMDVDVGSLLFSEHRSPELGYQDHKGPPADWMGAEYNDLNNSLLPSSNLGEKKWFTNEVPDELTHEVPTIIPPTASSKSIGYENRNIFSGRENFEPAQVLRHNAEREKMIHSLMLHLKGILKPLSLVDVHTMEDLSGYSDYLEKHYGISKEDWQWINKLLTGYEDSESDSEFEHLSCLLTRKDLSLMISGLIWVEHPEVFAPLREIMVVMGDSTDGSESDTSAHEKDSEDSDSGDEATELDYSVGENGECDEGYGIGVKLKDNTLRVLVADTVLEKDVGNGNTTPVLGFKKEATRKPVSFSYFHGKKFNKYYDIFSIVDSQEPIEEGEVFNVIYHKRPTSVDCALGRAQFYGMHYLRDPTFLIIACDECKERKVSDSEISIPIDNGLIAICPDDCREFIKENSIHITEDGKSTSYPLLQVRWTLENKKLALLINDDLLETVKLEAFRLTEGCGFNIIHKENEKLVCSSGFIIDFKKSENFDVYNPNSAEVATEFCDRNRQSGLIAINARKATVCLLKQWPQIKQQLKPEQEYRVEQLECSIQ